MGLKPDVEVDGKKISWTLSVGDKKITNGKNTTAAYMLSQMDSLAAEGAGQPLVIETDVDKVLKTGAEYAAQKGYDLVSADPAQNLKIIEAQKAIIGEDIAEGSLEPSVTLELQQPAPDPELEKKQALEKLAQDRRDVNTLRAEASYSDDPTQRAREFAQAKAIEAEIIEREKAFREKGWLPPLENQSPHQEQPPIERAQPAPVSKVQADNAVEDIAKIGEQMRAAPASFHGNEVEAPETPTVQRFPVKAPPEVIALTRHKYAAAKDHGDKLVITRMGMMAVTPAQKRDRADLVQAMLLKSRERFGEPVRITGNAPFEQEVIKAAIAQGIPLEMTSVHGEKAYAKALEAQQKQKPGLGTAGQMAASEIRSSRTSPAESGAFPQAPSVQKEAPAKGKGVGRELKIG